MPLHVPPADVCRFTLSGVNGTDAYANIFHAYLPGNTLDQVTLSGWCADLNSDANLQAMYGMGAGQRTCNLIKAELSDGTDILEASSAASLSGTDDTQVLPGGVAAVISWLGSWHYRGGKPRTYYGGLTVGWLNDARTLDGGHISDLQGFASDWMATFNAYTSANVTTQTLGVLLGNTASSAGTFAPYFGVLVRPQVGSQRRRQR